MHNYKKGGSFEPPFQFKIQLFKPNHIDQGSLP